VVLTHHSRRTFALPTPLDEFPVRLVGDALGAPAKAGVPLGPGAGDLGDENGVLFLALKAGADMFQEVAHAAVIDTIWVILGTFSREEEFP